MDTVKTPDFKDNSAPKSACCNEFASRLARTWGSYLKFKSNFNYRGAAEAYRNMLFDTLIRRIVILSGSEFGCAGEILSDEDGL